MFLFVSNLILGRDTVFRPQQYFITIFIRQQPTNTAPCQTRRVTVRALALVMRCRADVQSIIHLYLSNRLVKTVGRTVTTIELFKNVIKTVMERHINEGLVLKQCGRLISMYDTVLKSRVSGENEVKVNRFDEKVKT